MLGPLSFKLRVLAKQVSQDFMHSFTGLIAPGNLPFPAQGHTCIVLGLSLVGDVGSQEIRRLLTDRMRTQAMSIPRGEGPLIPYSIVPQVLP